MKKKILHYIQNINFKRKNNHTNKTTILNTVQKDTFKKRKKQLTINFSIFHHIKALSNTLLRYYIVPLIAIMGVITFLIIWPVFTVKTINIIKKDDITNINIAYERVEEFRWSKIFTLDKEKILKKLITRQQNITDIELNIKLPSTLIIHVESSKWVFNTIINKKEYIITQKWTLIPQKHSSEFKTIDIVSKFDENVFLDYKNIFKEKHIKEISHILRWLEENIIDLKIGKVQYYPVEREVHIHLDNNTILLFSLNPDTEKQIEKAAIFNKEHLKLNDIKLIYIDLRIKNKVFYCIDEDEYICTQNLKKIYNK